MNGHALHVTVQEDHHGNTDVRTTYELGDLPEVVVAVRSYDETPRFFRL